MALDPLKFLVEIQDEATAKLNDIEKKINDVVKDRKFKISIEGIGELKAALSQVSSTIKMTGSSELNAKFEPRIKALKEQLDSSKDLTIQYAKLIATIENKQANLSNLLAGGGNSKYFDTQIKKAIDQYQQMLNDIKTGRNNGLLSEDHLKNLQKNLSVLSTQYKNVESNAAKYNKTQERLTAEEKRIAQALNQSTQAAKGHSQVLGDLKSMAMQYLSVWGAQNFLNNIIEVGGQLEKQRLSIGAILGDISHANDLFGKIKDLAIKSPFGVVELDQFTKQLSAYGFKYNELYDMTKRLADIAAGAGTDVSRLTLAIGHVRAEGALTGYTLRQFAMNNIPMVSELAKKLSEVEHRIVTVSDVRKRVRNKEIGYEDVIDVIKNLTNEGGMFYNMQETISQSIQSRFKNLRDSLDIMYGEIAESGIGDALKEVAVILTDMSRNWKSFIPVIESSVLAWATYKAAIISVSMAMGKNTMAVTSNMLSYKKKRAEELLHESMVRKLTIEEERLVATRNKLTAENIRVAMTTGAMTKADALKLVALRKVDLETTKALIHMDMFTAAEARMARNGRLLWMNLGKVGASLKLFGASAWSSIKGLASSVFTPLNAAFAALTIGMSAKQRQDEFKEVREQRRNAINERANEGYKNLLEATKNFSVGNSVNMTKTDINLSLDEMMEKLKEYSMFYNTTFNDAFKVNQQGYAVHSLAEQYEILAKGLENAANAHKMFAEMRDLVAHALETSDPSNGFWKNVGDTMYGWMLSDDAKAKIGSLTDSLERFAQTTRDVGIAENLLLRDHISLRTALNGRGLGDVMNMTNDELIRTLSKLRSTMPDVFTAVRLSLSAESREMLDDWTAKCNSMNEAYAASNLKMRKAGNDLYESMKVQYGGDMSKWPSEWREFVFMAMDAATKDVKGFSDMSIEYQNLVRDSFLKPFNISVDSDEAKEKVNDLYVDLQNLVGKTWTIKIGVKGESAWDDLETSGKKYQDADKKVKQFEKNLKRLNYVSGSYLNSREAEKVAEEYNDAIAERRAARILYESYGGDVSELDKEKNKKNKGGSKKDEFLEMWKDRISILEKYRQEREALEKYLTREQAESKLRKDGNFNSLWDYFANPNDYKGSIDAVIGKIKASGLTDDRRKFVDDLGAKNGAEDLRVFKENTENAVSELGRMLSVMKENYDVYKKWVDLTGDESLAAKIAGVTQNTSYADVLKDKFSEIGASANMSAEKFFGLKESEVKAFGEKSGLYKLWEEWQDNLKKIKREDIDLYEEAIKGAKGYAEQVDDVNRKLKERLAAIDKMAKSPEEKSQLRANAQANANEEIAKYTWENFKKTEDFGRIFSDLDKVTTKTLRGMLENLRMVAPSIRDNVEAAKSLYEALDKIEKVVNERKPFKAISDSLKTMSSLRELRSKGVSNIGFRNTNGTYTIGADIANKLGLNINKTGEYTDKELSDAYRAAGQEFMAGVSGLKAEFDTLASSLEPVISLFNSLGMTELGDIVGGIQSALGSAVNTGMGASMLFGASAGPWGAAIGAGISLLGTFFEMHDNSIQEQIEAIEREVNALEQNTNAIKTFRDRTLGYDTGELRRLMANQYNNATRQKTVNIFGKDYTFDYQSAAIKAMREFYKMNSGGTGYAQELENLKKQREDYIKMYDLEADKKKSSQDALDEYKAKIAELDDQIAYFAQDLANELYSLNLKEWGDQIGDALMTAFENGEDAAKAFKDTVQDIMRQVLRKMLSIGIIEPMMERLQKKLFGDNGKGGSFDANNPEGTIDAAMRDVAEFFGDNGEGQKMIAATQAFYEKWEDLMRSYGMTLADESKSSSATEGIKGITEQTADLIASYINAIRADTSVIRAMSAQYFPMYYAVLTSSNASLKNIENHTSAIMRSNDAIEKSNQAILDRIDGLRNKAWKVPVA